AVPILLNLLQDKHIKVPVVEILGNIKDVQALEPLIDILNKRLTIQGIIAYEDREFFLEVVDAVGKLGNRRATNTLLEILNKLTVEKWASLQNVEREHTGHHRKEIGSVIRALGNIRDERAFVPVIDLLKEIIKEVCKVLQKERESIQIEQFYSLSRLVEDIVDTLVKVGNRKVIEVLKESLAITPLKLEKNVSYSVPFKEVIDNPICVSIVKAIDALEGKKYSSSPITIPDSVIVRETKTIDDAIARYGALKEQGFQGFIPVGENEPWIKEASRYLQKKNHQQLELLKSLIKSGKLRAGPDAENVFYGICGLDNGENKIILITTNQKDPAATLIYELNAYQDGTIEENLNAEKEFLAWKSRTILIKNIILGVLPPALIGFGILLAPALFGFTLVPVVAFLIALSVSLISAIIIGICDYKEKRDHQRVLLPRLWFHISLWFTIYFLTLNYELAKEPEIAQWVVNKMFLGEQHTRLILASLATTLAWPGLRETIGNLKKGYVVRLNAWKFKVETLKEKIVKIINNIANVEEKEKVTTEFNALLNKIKGQSYEKISLAKYYYYLSERNNAIYQSNQEQNTTIAKFIKDIQEKHAKIYLAYHALPVSLLIAGFFAGPLFVYAWIGLLLLPGALKEFDKVISIAGSLFSKQDAKGVAKSMPKRVAHIILGMIIVIPLFLISVLDNFFFRRARPIAETVINDVHIPQDILPQVIRAGFVYLEKPKVIKVGCVSLEKPKMLSWRVQKFAVWARQPYAYNLVFYALWRIILMGIGVVFTQTLTPFLEKQFTWLTVNYLKDYIKSIPLIGNFLALYLDFSGIGLIRIAIINYALNIGMVKRVVRIIKDLSYRVSNQEYVLDTLNADRLLKQLNTVNLQYAWKKGKIYFDTVEYKYLYEKLLDKQEVVMGKALAKDLLLGVPGVLVYLILPITPWQVISAIFKKKSLVATYFSDEMAKLQLNWHTSYVGLFTINAEIGAIVFLGEMARGPFAMVAHLLEDDPQFRQMAHVAGEDKPV
ncbi:MAG: hypothetical protein L6263_03715, partial [Desulfobacteraceae bacterium]|nr:hypothetical protein [Desulfobacteraceae bacterium]